MPSTLPPPGWCLDTVILPPAFVSRIHKPIDHPINIGTMTMSWTSLQQNVPKGRLDGLGRYPSMDDAYKAWRSEMGHFYPCLTTYLLEQSLFWTERGMNQNGKILFDLCGTEAFADERDYKTLRNEFPYAFEPGIHHVCVWFKHILPADEKGVLTPDSALIVDRFVGKEFRTKVGEKEKGSQVLWFKNSYEHQSVRGIEHLHILLKDVEEQVISQWIKPRVAE